MTGQIIFGIVVALVFTASTAVYWHRRGQVPEAELVNEAHGRFRPSSNKSDPQCPRCHGTGRARDYKFSDCPICKGQRHVKFGSQA